MQIIHFNGQITTITAKKDGSLGLRMETPELGPEQKALFFELQNLNLDVSLNPRDESNVPEIKIDKDLDQKTSSQRLRAVLFVLWEKEGKQSDWEVFYRNRMEKFIDWVKQKLE